MAAFIAPKEVAFSSNLEIKILFQAYCRGSFHSSRGHSHFQAFVYQAIINPIIHFSTRKLFSKTVKSNEKYFDIQKLDELNRHTTFTQLLIQVQIWAFCQLQQRSEGLMSGI